MNQIAVPMDMTQMFVNRDEKEGFGHRFDCSILSPSMINLVDLENAWIMDVFNADSNVVQCICPPPNDGLLTGEKRMSATVWVYEGFVPYKLPLKDKIDDKDDIIVIKTEMDSEVNVKQVLAVLVEANQIMELIPWFEKLIPCADTGACYNEIKILSNFVVMNNILIKKYVF
jgi:hypothetical protein